MTKLKLEEMTYPEVRTALQQGYDKVVVTFGSIEQHGPHLPLITDSLWGEAIGERLARKLDRALLAPALRLGVSEHHMHFPGTISLRKEVFIEVVYDYCQSLARHGFKHIILVPTHGGNYAPLAEAMDKIRPVLPDVNLIAFHDMQQWLAAVYRLAGTRGISPQQAGAHAGQWETSQVLALRPELTDMGSAQPGFTGTWSPGGRARTQPEGIHLISPNGILGDPAGSSAEFGEMYLDTLTDLLVAYVTPRLRAA